MVGPSYTNCLKVNLVPRIFTEGRPKYRQRPWKRGFVSMESVIRAGDVFFPLSNFRCWTTKVYGDSLIWHLCGWNGSTKSKSERKGYDHSHHNVGPGTSYSIFTVVRHKDARQSHERWMVSLWNVLCLLISSPRFPLIPIPPEKPSESRLRSLLDMEPLNLYSYVSLSFTGLWSGSWEAVFEQEIRPTPAALIDKEFVAKMQAFFQKETEFNERLEQIQRVADRTARFNEKGGKIPERRPNGKRLPKEFSVGHLNTDTTESKCLKFCIE